MFDFIARDWQFIAKNAPWLINTFAFLFGAIVGSFLNVCIWRMPRDESVIHPGSHCGSCNKPIRWYDNIPIISFFALGGRCRSCGARYSGRYVMVEALTGILFFLIWRQYGWTNPPLAIAYLIFASGCVVAAIIDLEHYIIPDVITVGGTIVGVIYSALWPSLQVSTRMADGLTESMLGILVGSGIILWVMVIGEIVFQKEAMGFGDVKLMGAIGAFLGWQATVFTIAIGCVTGAVIGVGLLFWRKNADREIQEDRHMDDAELSYLIYGGTENSSIPFGPFLIFGALVWVLLQEFTIGGQNIHLRTWMMEQLGTFYCMPDPYPCMKP